MQVNNWENKRFFKPCF